MKYNILFILLLCFTFVLETEAKHSTQQRNNGFRIEVDAPSKEGSTIYLARYWNGLTYIQDSLQISDQGKALFFSSDTLPAGQYLIYIKPDISLDLLIDKEQDNITIKIDKDNIFKSTVSGSKDSKMFLKHMAYINEKRTEKSILEKQLADSTISQQKRMALNTELNALEKSVKSHITSTIERNRGNWFGKFLKGLEAISLPYPEPKTEEEVEKNRAFGKAHYFDNIDLADPRFWYTNYLTNYIDTYMQQWVEPIPDSLAIAASRLVEKTKGNDFTFQQMLSRFINESSKSQLMGHENIWAKLTEDYVLNKNNTWIDSVQLSQLKKNYAAIQHNRIGMGAHPLTLVTIDEQSFNTDNIAADYLILYFYDPNCGHCQKELPLLHNEFYPKYKNKGVKIVAINIGADLDNWKRFVEKNKFTNWINAADPSYKSEYWMYYDTTAIPAIFVLDKNKNIVAKKIDKQNLEKFFEFYIKK